MIEVRFEIMGQKFMARNKTFEQAIAALKRKKGFFAKGSGILKVRKGNDKFKEKIIGRPLAARLFGESQLANEIAHKQIQTLFDL